MNPNQMLNQQFQPSMMINPVQNQQLQQQLAFEAEAIRYKLEQDRIMRTQQYQLKVLKFFGLHNHFNYCIEIEKIIIVLLKRKLCVRCVS